MAYIDLGVDEKTLPGITGLMRFRPETAKPLSELADVLLRGPHSLPAAERELIAAYVSGLNDCGFCSLSHAASAVAQYAAADVTDGAEIVARVRADLDSAPIPAKLKALLRIAGAVNRSGHAVTPELVEAARLAGATDVELHDTVLIAAAFGMFNRYVDGLATFAPEAAEDYVPAAQRILVHGYGIPRPS
ncbi:putative peroxidase-related enzyme [Actinoplanes octamycinicus]|uniref:Putative peroxidase-related enzyme n=1 Tax=Actinoplanes octamycinicus TaxID=135948 RepID=A0A7W7H1J6_9ACTN|nr:carboxymuconolactone decarboxylase family protein [Actinoplanes octamycinicus]MBB4742285.1 putative peroxidase-related enzyme [Actinoplanes octamycinicus]GIE59870.1 carboxymuconolactone decarboxylase [Actinoplanes octamycinicus]